MKITKWGSSLFLQIVQNVELGLGAHIIRRSSMVFRDVTYLAVVVRIFCAVVIGGIIGIERSIKNRPAGLRTYMLVSVGACLIMLTNQYIYQLTGTGDPMRLGAQVVSGIGFLGAGTIMVTKHNQIKGLTTAAGLWSAAGVGLAIGIGFYEAAITATVAIYVTLTVLHALEARVNRKTRVLEVYVEVQDRVPFRKVISDIRGLGVAIDDIQLQEDGSQGDGIKGYVMCLKSAKRRDHLLFVEDVLAIDGIVHVEEL